MPDRRPSLWVDTLFVVNLASGGAVVQDLMGTLLENETRLSQLTLVRTIVGIDVAYTVHDSSEGSQLGALGIFVAGREAVLAGVASMPHPNVAADFPALPWVMRAQYRVYGFSADQAAVYDRRVDLDIRSQRKLANGELVVVFTNDAFEGIAASVSFTGMIRCLFLV